MNAKENTERQKDYYERMKSAGMKKVSVYVPAKDVAKLQEYAANLRKAITV